MVQARMCVECIVSGASLGKDTAAGCRGQIHARANLQLIEHIPISTASSLLFMIALFLIFLWTVDLFGIFLCYFVTSTHNCHAHPNFYLKLQKMFENFENDCCKHCKCDLLHQIVLVVIINTGI